MGFNNCVGSQYHKYAYQFHSAIGNGKCGIKNVKDKYDNNPYNAPRGALVVVSAGTGTAHPVAGDIAVASGDGRFWNGGNMACGVQVTITKAKNTFQLPAKVVVREK